MELIYESTGDMDISSANDMNVPVNSFLMEPDDESPKWRWCADNYMPRKAYSVQGAYNIDADSRDVIMELIREHVTPLYRAAVTNLESKGGNYYWEVDSK